MEQETCNAEDHFTKSFTVAIVKTETIVGHFLTYFALF